MKKVFLALVLACALLPAAGFAQNQDGNSQGGNSNSQGGNSISAQEMSGIGIAAATLLGAVAYLGLRRRANRSKS